MGVSNEKLLCVRTNFRLPSNHIEPKSNHPNLIANRGRVDTYHRAQKEQILWVLFAEDCGGGTVTARTWGQVLILSFHVMWTMSPLFGATHFFSATLSTLVLFWGYFGLIHFKANEASLKNDYRFQSVKARNARLKLALTN